MKKPALYKYLPKEDQSVLLNALTTPSMKIEQSHDGVTWWPKGGKCLMFDNYYRVAKREKQ